jgi:hypothetical protein
VEGEMRGTGIQAKPSQPSTERESDIGKLLGDLVNQKLADNNIKLPETQTQVAETQNVPAVQNHGNGVVV